MSPGKKLELPSESLSFGEIVERYEGQWILIEVTQREEGWPSEGIILARSLKRTGISAAHIKVLREPKPGASYYLFQAVHHLRTGDEVRQAIAEAQRQGIKDAWRRW